MGISVFICDSFKRENKNNITLKSLNVHYFFLHRKYCCRPVMLSCCALKGYFCANMNGTFASHMDFNPDTESTASLAKVI